ncbi:MAG: PAS domain-containing sensor histidine kinase [Rhizomicrobium sp.]|jgi:signal transduction histidine kinase
MSTLIDELGRLGVAAASLDAENRVVAATAELARALGATPASLAGVDLAVFLQGVASKKTGDGPSGAYRIAHGATPSWHRLDLKATEGGFLAVLVDVTRECQSLEDIDNFYTVRNRLLLDGKIGTWRYDPDAGLYYFSSELSLGHEQAAQPVPVALLQLIQHPDDREKDTAIRERITREGGVANAEMRYLENGGGWTHLNVHYRAGNRLPSGLYEILGISQNITAVAVARDEAAQASQRLALALRAAHAGVFEYNYKDQSFWISPELTALVGDETLGQVEGEWPRLFVEADRDAARTFFRNAENTAHASSIDLRMIQPHGHRWIKFYFDVKDRDAAGKPLLGIGLLIDTDDLKRQEIALAEARRAADFANRSKTEFLANMSHELRTPLNAILGFSEIIERQMFGAIAPKYVEYAHDIHRSGEHLLSLINDVLDLAKLEAGKLELRESVVHLPAVVDDCLTLVRGRADAGRIALAFEPGAAVPSLRADARVVKQLLINFLSNAVKFTPEGGRVVVRTLYDATGSICLSVADSGIGMTDAEVAVALSPFGQIDSTLARKHEGTGLGLPICKSLMELHGGELSIDSKPNRGTIATAHFPAGRTVRETPFARAS